LKRKGLPRRRPLYSACNEDTRSEIRALEPAHCDTIVCVAAGGGRALSLLAAGGGRLLAVDRRAAQLHVLELKAAALDALPHAVLRRFLGLDPCAGRLDAYAALRGSLTPGARRYWDRRSRLVASGILYAGRLETRLAAFSAWLRRAGRFRWPATCFAAPDLATQRALLHRHRGEVERDEHAFALLLHPLFGWLALQDPSFLRSTEGNPGRCLYRRFARFAERRLLRESALLHLIYFGRYDPEGTLPPWLTREGAEAARQGLARLELVCADLAELARGLRAGGRLGWSLSDVSCWMGERRFHALLAAIGARSAPGSRAVWRNLAALRALPPGADALGMRRLDALSAALERDDASVFYRIEAAEITGRALRCALAVPRRLDARGPTPESAA
jgi:S-adenosylmethionine-diacylglycerol 3-amino-3-carboxypropyl transferase